MDNLNNQFNGVGGANWTAPGTTSQGGKELPGATASQIMGIIGLILSLCTGCGVVGFILSIIALVKGNKAIKEFEATPGVYSETSLKQAKVGRILGIIGLVLGLLVIVLLIIYIVVIGVTALNGRH